MSLTRRTFVSGASTLAFAGLLNIYTNKSFAESNHRVKGYGPLLTDPNENLDLPEGFSYKIISKMGDRMDDGYMVPDRADGMGCFALAGTQVALVRNHEIGLDNYDPEMSKMQRSLLSVAYDMALDGLPLPGGTTTIVYDTKTGERVNEYRSLIGTIRNCSGGKTPWGSWISCEEFVSSYGEVSILDHGWAFEVPAVGGSRFSRPLPLKGLGRFNHEGAAVDPSTGIVYMTEDRPNGLLYRFVPNVYGQLDKGGKLQAFGLMDRSKSADSRNWDGITFNQGDWHDAKWVDLDDIESPKDDLRLRGHEKGAVLFARGEGITWGDNEIYFCCTNGGVKGFGQIMRYKPSAKEGNSGENDEPGKLQLFLESDVRELFSFGDNLTVAPNGHLIVCEDNYDHTANYIRGVTPEGALYPLARLIGDSETSGACFSPDGSILFVNIQSPTKTLAITGPWDKFSV
ncbi:MAG: DUF839 domain-containing protein [Kordiimonadaceae bacterium]|nr:DUF839 domain-containing protein [Kordiimonadaceae bacterium]